MCYEGQNFQKPTYEFTVKLSDDVTSPLPNYIRPNFDVDANSGSFDSKAFQTERAFILGPNKGLVSLQCHFILCSLYP